MLKRIATAITLATTMAALAVPAGLASSKPKNYGPPDPWMLRYLNASPIGLAAGFLTDTTDSARVARAHPAVELTAARPQVRIAPGTLRGGFLTDTTDSARVARAHPAVELTAARPQTRIAPGTLRGGFLTDTTDSARVARITELHQGANT
jgi:hypothetical protein